MILTLKGAQKTANSLTRTALSEIHLFIMFLEGQMNIYIYNIFMEGYSNKIIFIRKKLHYNFVKKIFRHSMNKSID